MVTKVAVVVGAGPGIGLAVAKRFAKEGYTIALLSRNLEKLTDYQKEVDNSHVFVCDAGQEESFKAAFAEVKSKLGVPEVVVFNVYAPEYAPLETATAEGMQKSFFVNVTAALVCAQQVLPEWKAAKKGSFLTTGGGLSLGPLPSMGMMALGKAALRSFNHSMFIEMKDQGIHFSTVTVCGVVGPGTFYDPDKIAAEFWNLHTQKQREWTHEFVFRENESR